MLTHAAGFDLFTFYHKALKKNIWRCKRNIWRCKYGILDF